jgi:hypothetical protein
VGPRAERWQADERQCAPGKRDRPAVVGPERAVTELGQLRSGERLAGHGGPQRFEVDSQTFAPPALRLDVRGGDERVLRPAHHVQRAAQRPGVDDRSGRERTRQLLLPKALDA